MIKIVNSLSKSNEFFIFREDGTEIKCYIDHLKTVRSIKYRLTSEERRLIKDTYITYHIKKVPLKMTHYINPFKTE
jgi:hypothetical protein